MKAAIHHHENNNQSQTFLEENKSHFSQQCLKVLELLRQGRRLTTINAPTYGILSLPRRIKDLKDKNGVHVDERWIEVGGIKVKEWFIEQKVENEIQQWFSQYQNEQPQPISKFRQTELFQ